VVYYLNYACRWVVIPPKPVQQVRGEDRSGEVEASYARNLVPGNNFSENEAILDFYESYMPYSIAIDNGTGWRRSHTFVLISEDVATPGPGPATAP